MAILPFNLFSLIFVPISIIFLLFPSNFLADDNFPPVPRLQGVAVKGRLVCGKNALKGAKVKIVDLDKRPDRDDLMGEFLTDENGLFQVSGATREVEDIQVVLKVYHDCLDEHQPCQRRTIWQIPSNYYNNGTLTEWFDIGTINMEMVFPLEERDCRH